VRRRLYILLAGLWFARAAGRISTATGERLTNGYYAVMMAAMAWMFAAMNGRLPGQIGHSFDRAPSEALAMNMSETDMTSTHQMSSTGTGAQWITMVNWVATLGFGIVALYWACQYIARRRIGPVLRTGQLARLEPLYQVCTAAGTALMFGTLP